MLRLYRQKIPLEGNSEHLKFSSCSEPAFKILFPTEQLSVCFVLFCVNFCECVLFLVCNVKGKEAQFYCSSCEGVLLPKVCPIIYCSEKKTYKAPVLNLNSGLLWIHHFL